MKLIGADNAEPHPEFMRIFRRISHSKRKRELNSTPSSIRSRWSDDIEYAKFISDPWTNSRHRSNFLAARKTTDGREFRRKQRTFYNVFARANCWTTCCYGTQMRQLRLSRISRHPRFSNFFPVTSAPCSLYAARRKGENSLREKGSCLAENLQILWVSVTAAWTPPLV